MYRRSSALLAELPALSLLIVLVSVSGMVTTATTTTTTTTRNHGTMLNDEAALIDLKNTIQLLREQMDAMIEHRQQDYNALEESLKRSIAKNTELTILRNEVKQLRKEVSALRGGGSGGSGGGVGGIGAATGNEAKNERLRVKWLGSAVTELRTEIAEVLRATNASEEFAQRSRMRSELDLVRGDVSQVGKSIRELGGRLTRIEASLGTIRLDIFAVKERAGQLTRNCADVTSQLSTIQIEMKSFKCHEMSNAEAKTTRLERDSRIRENNGVLDAPNGITRRKGGTAGGKSKSTYNYYAHRSSRHGLSRLSSGRRMVEERLMNLERKISMVARKRGILEKRVVYENKNENESRVRMARLEKSRGDIEDKVRNMSIYAENSVKRVDEAIIGLLESIENIEDKIENNGSEGKREIARLEINAARKYAELSLTREELNNLRRTVQALSVSASKLQEKSDLHQTSLNNLKESVVNLTRTSKVRASEITRELEHAEDDYRSMIDSLPGNCEDRDGLTMLAPGGQASPLLVSCRRGWIVIGRRIDGIVDFDRTWNEYAAGFGSSMNELWLGNEALHRLTRDNCTRLRIDMTDIYGNPWRADYETFRVDSEDTGYRLGVYGYTGNATDAFSYQNGMSFSAKDRDMDISSADCAANYRGGWWFSHCQHANLNGRYSLGLAWYRSDIKQWMAVVTSVMSVQRKHNCS